MRRWSTALIVVAVAALAVFAAADALRGRDEQKAPAASPTSTRPKAPTLRETLRGQGVSGQILYSDQDCILHSLVLPQMVDDVVRGENGAGAVHYCRFSAAGGRILEEGERMSPDGSTIARCRGGTIVASPTRAAARSSRRAGHSSRLGSCAPRPGFTPTSPGSQREFRSSPMRPISHGWTKNISSRRSRSVSRV